MRFVPSASPICCAEMIASCCAYIASPETTSSIVGTPRTMTSDAVGGAARLSVVLAMAAEAAAAVAAATPRRATDWSIW